MKIIPFAKEPQPKIARELKAALENLETIRHSFKKWCKDNPRWRCKGSEPWSDEEIADEEAEAAIRHIQELLALPLREQLELLDIVTMKPKPKQQEKTKQSDVPYVERDCNVERYIYNFLKRRFTTPRIAEIGATLIRRATGTKAPRRAESTATARAASACAALQALTEEEGAMALAMIGAIEHARRGDASSLRLAIVKLSRRVLPANDVAQLTVQLVRDMATWSSDKAEQAGA
jgi:hypothetical protein